MTAALTPEEQAAGFVRPIRLQVVHREPCGRPSPVNRAQAEDMARDPKSWSSCYCNVCGHRRPLDEFTWPDGEPVGS